MADTATIASLATAGGTLILAVATFASTRSANRSARIAERALDLNLRPVLIPAHEWDAAERVTFYDEIVQLRGGFATVEDRSGKVHSAIYENAVAISKIRGAAVQIAEADVSVDRVGPISVADGSRVDRKIMVRP